MRSTAPARRAPAPGAGGRSRRSAAILAVAAAALLLALAACAPSGSPAPSCSPAVGPSAAAGPAACRTAAPRALPLKPTPSPTPTAGDLPDGSALVPLDGDSSDVGPTSVMTAKASAADPPSIDVATTAVNGTAVRSTDDSIAPPSAGTVSGWVIGTQHDRSAAVSGAVVRTVHTDASGLAPEAWTTTVQAFTPGSGLVGDPVALRQCTTASCELHGTARFGPVALVDYRPDDGGPSNRVLALDLATGATVWSRDDAALATFSATSAVLRRADGEGNGGAEHPVTAVDPATGHVRWRFADRDHDPAEELGPVLSEQYAVITSEDENDPQPRSNLVDLTDGHVVAVRYGDGSWAYDPAESRVVVSGTAGTAYADPDLTVLSTTGAIVYGISHARYEALGSPPVIGAVDGRAWIPASSTVDAFDTATGEQDPGSPAVTGDTGLLFPKRYDGAAISVGDQGSDSGGAVLLDPAGVPSYAAFTALRLPAE